MYLGGGVGLSCSWLRHCPAWGGQWGCPWPWRFPPSLRRPPDMLLLKKQTEDISSVYEIREKLGS